MDGLENILQAAFFYHCNKAMKTCGFCEKREWRSFFVKINSFYLKVIFDLMFNDSSDQSFTYLPSDLLFSWYQ